MLDFFCCCCNKPKCLCGHHSIPSVLNFPSSTSELLVCPGSVCTDLIRAFWSGAAERVSLTEHPITFWWVFVVTQGLRSSFGLHSQDSGLKTRAETVLGQSTFIHVIQIHGLERPQAHLRLAQRQIQARSRLRLYQPQLAFSTVQPCFLQVGFILGQGFSGGG